jgi:flagellar basal body-associated protein FliL
LTSFQKAEKEDSMDILVIGIGVLVAVVVIVAVAMAMRKKGKKPQAAPPQTPPPAQ